jgi:hypothetical protein
MEQMQDICRGSVGPLERTKEVLRVQIRAEVANILLDVKIHVCLPRKYGHFILFIDNNLLLPDARLHILNNIYRK